MKTKTEEFEVLIPNLDGTEIAERVKIPVTLEWDEEVKEWLLTPEAHEAIESTKARRIGLLLPAQLKELRERYNYSQKEMGELFQAGEKSWTRWETGKQRPSRSINLLIRALFDGAISIHYLLKRAGKVPHETEVTAEKIWWDLISNVSAVKCIVVRDRGTVQFHKGSGKSQFLKAVLSNAQQATPMWPLQVKRTRSTSLRKTNKRFPYEKVELA